MPTEIPKYIPSGAGEEIDKMFTAVACAKSLVEGGFLDEIEAELVTQTLADLEVRAGDLYESFRELLSDARGEADEEPDVDDDFPMELEYNDVPGVNAPYEYDHEDVDHGYSLDDGWIGGTD